MERAQMGLDRGSIWDMPFPHVSSPATNHLETQRGSARRNQGRPFAPQ